MSVTYQIKEGADNAFTINIYNYYVLEGMSTVWQWFILIKIIMGLRRTLQGMGESYGEGIILRPIMN